MDSKSSFMGLFSVFSTSKSAPQKRTTTPPRRTLASDRDSDTAVNQSPQTRQRVVMRGPAAASSSAAAARGGVSGGATKSRGGGKSSASCCMTASLSSDDESENKDRNNGKSKARKPMGKSVQVYFCVSWQRVFLILCLFYFVLSLVIYVVVTTSSSSSSKTASTPSSLTVEESPMNNLKASIANLGKSSITNLGKSSITKLGDTFRMKNNDNDNKNPDSSLSKASSSSSFLSPSLAKKLFSIDYASSNHAVESYSSALYQKLETHLGLVSCRRRSKMSGLSSYYSLESSCPKDGQIGPITYYNPLPHSRYICGGNTLIHGQSSVQLQQPCMNSYEPSRLFPVIPDRTGQGIPVTRTKFCESCGNFVPFTDCDIPCESAGQPSTVGVRYIDGTNWHLEFSMEGEKYYPRLAFNPLAYRTSKFYSTTSYQSEVPLPYYSEAEYKIKGPALNYDEAVKGAVFLARNCNSANGREAIVQKLMASEHIRVDSLSSCLHNAEPDPGINLANKKQVMRHYLFYLAFENQVTPDYITEKLWGPLEAGTVPVYFGAPNVKDHAPNNSLIAVNDFATIDDLALHLKEVASNKELYESYHAWRAKPLEPHFRQKYDFTKVHSTCRTCRWAYSKLYGLGWNHDDQTLVDLRVSRTVCLEQETGDKSLEFITRSHVSGTKIRGALIQKPFVEEWWSQSVALGERTLSEQEQEPAVAASDSEGTCRTVETTNRVLTVLDNSAENNKDSSIDNLRRSVWEHDGVIDIVLEGTISEPRLLRLRTPLGNATSANADALSRSSDDHDIPELFAVGAGQYRMQNNFSRFTVLTQPRTIIPMPVVTDPDAGSTTTGDGEGPPPHVLMRGLGTDGVVDLVIRATELPTRVRIIVEDIDTFHFKADEVEYYFAKRMIEDFYNPVEGFVPATTK